MAETSNSSASPTEVPIALLETFLPGFGIISGIVNATLGFDITQFVTAAFIVFAFAGALRYVYSATWDFFSRWYTASITIDDCERLYDDVMSYMRIHVLSSERARSMKAQDGSAGLENPHSEIEVPKTEYGPLMLFNYAFVEANMPPEYSPAYGVNRFWHKGRLFFIDRYAVEWSDGEKSRDDRIEITCYGRSTQPIKDFLTECKRESAERAEYKTTIRTPSGRHWDKLATRASRPWETVCLDAKLKEEFLEDVCEFLDPVAPRFYARRGIPYRRGYLFYGPPGTGKSSLAIALAGIVGLDLYTLSLVDEDMNDGDLAALLSNVSSRCIVLVEDIDAAGIKRPDELEDDTAGPDKKGKKNKGNKPAKNEGKKKSSITLSGLLNALDGVGSQEGRVLLMTTNNPESLDKALVRPGRIDMQVPFSYATPQQAVDIFVRMYSKDDDGPITTGKNERRHSAKPGVIDLNKQNAEKGLSIPTTAPSVPKSTNAPLDLPTPPPSPFPPKGQSTPADPTPSGSTASLVSSTSEQPSTRQTTKFTLYDPDSPVLQQMASEFATYIPQGKFTPAEVQGYLLRRRKSPGKALEEAEAWREELLAAKEAGKNVIAGIEG
ncbi:MAG: hypothetical protein M1831_000493 [Alyxoria varia]|nr:MAG: hypothetical protein M1831_000493 [Alyxoria varia]